MEDSFLGDVEGRPGWFGFALGWVLFLICLPGALLFVFGTAG